MVMAAKALPPGWRLRSRCRAPSPRAHGVPWTASSVACLAARAGAAEDTAGIVGAVETVVGFFVVIFFVVCSVVGAVVDRR